MTATQGADASDTVLTLVELEGFTQAIATAIESARSGEPHALFVVRVERLADAVSGCGDDAAPVLDHLVQQTLLHQVGDHVSGCRLAPDRFALLKARCLPHDASLIARRIVTAWEGGVFRWRELSFRLGAQVSALELGTPRLSNASQALEEGVQACLACEDLGNDGVLVIHGTPGERQTLEGELEWRGHLREVL